jgi:ATP/maltotriose-dependent transcriptional regulator MalT
VTGRARRRPCTAEDARTRAAHARAYLEVAKLIHGDADKPEDLNFNHVAAGNAVLDLLAQGSSNREIASHLGIADKTVRNHLSSHPESADGRSGCHRVATEG